MTIGTGGQVFVPLTRPLIDPALRLHTFCHAPPARWYLLGAMLSAGMALRWLRSVLGRGGASYEELVQLAAEVQPGSEGLFFLPYLPVGERSPLMDPEAKAGFIGLALHAAMQRHWAQAGEMRYSFRTKTGFFWMTHCRVFPAHWHAANGCRHLS